VHTGLRMKRLLQQCQGRQAQSLKEQGGGENDTPHELSQVFRLMRFEIDLFRLPICRFSKLPCCERASTSASRCGLGAQVIELPQASRVSRSCHVAAATRA
jgi:hypothetical protein